MCAYTACLLKCPFIGLGTLVTHPCCLQQAAPEARGWMHKKQLLAEEDEEAAKTAVKKPNKLRQKLKKPQQVEGMQLGSMEPEPEAASRLQPITP